MIYACAFSLAAVILITPATLFVTLMGAKTEQQLLLGILTCYMVAALFGLLFGLIVECCFGCLSEEVRAFRRRTVAQALTKKHN